MIKKKICNLSQLQNQKYFKSWIKEFRDKIIIFKKDRKVYVKSSISPHFGEIITYNSGRNMSTSSY